MMLRRVSTSGKPQPMDAQADEPMDTAASGNSKYDKHRSVWPTIAAIVVVLLGLHAAFKTAMVSSSHADSSSIPDLFIYRRTKKSGSSSMLTELLEILMPLGYQPLYLNEMSMDVVVRHEFIRSSPRRLLVAEHNKITRQHHPHRHAVIADTVRDGYAQITSYCRYVNHVERCDDQVINCIRDNSTLRQITYRWADRLQEDEDTYIDLPLSSAHPALSTTILRTVFPGVVVREAMYNVKSSSCADIPQIRDVYNSFYKQLDAQVLMLRRRMLQIAGHVDLVRKSQLSNTSMEELLEQAEYRERDRYSGIDFNASSNNKGYSDVHHELILGMRHWSMKPTTELFIKASRQ